MKTNEAFSEEFGRIAELLRQPTKPEGLAFYLQALRQYDERECIQALRECALDAGARDFVRVPTPGDIIRKIREYRQEKWAKAANIDGPRMEPWEVELNDAVMPHFSAYLAKNLAAKNDEDRLANLNEWANNFAACARVLGVDHRIDWSAWCELGVTIEEPVRAFGQRPGGPLDRAMVMPMPGQVQA